MRLVGLRTLKTAITIFLCVSFFIILKSFELFEFIPDSFANNWFNPFFAALAGCYSLGDSKEVSLFQAKNRCVASLIGGTVGILLIFFYNLTGLSWPSLALIDVTKFNFLLPYTLVSICSMIVVIFGVKLKKQKAIFVALLTFLSITLNPGTIVENWEFQFGINRILSTIIGVLLALLVNFIHLPHFNKNDNIFYILNIDEILKSDDDNFKGFINYKLNNLSEKNIEYSFYTTRTPSTFMHLVKNYKINTNIICMNGAATYNTKTLTYDNLKFISKEDSNKLDEIFNNLNITPFVNTIINDCHYIYCERINNESERLYQSLKINASYVNYVSEKLTNKPILYYLLLEDKEVIDSLINILNETNLINDFRIETYDFLENVETNSNLKYIKIYSKDINDLSNLKPYFNKDICFISNDLKNSLANISKYVISDENKDYNKMFRDVEKLYYKKEFK